MTITRILCLPFTATFFLLAAIFVLPFLVPYLICKTLSWVVGVGLGDEETWHEHVFGDRA